MQVFRKFDYFRKSTSPEAIKPTFCGGLISLSCIVTLMFLILNEYDILQSPLIKKNMTVSTDPNKHPHIQINLDITFPNVPCYLIQIEASTEVIQQDEEKTVKYLKFSHFDKEGNTVEVSDSAYPPFANVDLADKDKTFPIIKNFYDSGHSCNIKGFIDMPKVKGNLYFLLKNGGSEMSALAQAIGEYTKENKEVKIQLNHKIKTLSFGNVHEQNQILRSDFAKVDNGQHTMFNMFMKDGKVKEELKTQPEENSQNYYYFLKMIPHTFVDLIDQNERTSYSYSLAHNKKDSDHPLAQYVNIILDYAPVRMIISKEERPVGQFMINLCSIVGGVFIIFGLFNSMVTSCLRS